MLGYANYWQTWDVGWILMFFAVFIKKKRRHYPTILATFEYQMNAWQAGKQATRCVRRYMFRVDDWHGSSDVADQRQTKMMKTMRIFVTKHTTTSKT